MNKKDLQRVIDKQGEMIAHLESEVSRLRNQKQTLEHRLAGYDRDFSTIRKIVGTEVNVGGGGGGAGGQVLKYGHGDVR